MKKTHDDALASALGGSDTATNPTTVLGGLRKDRIFMIGGGVLVLVFGAFIANMMLNNAQRNADHVGNDVAFEKTATVTQTPDFIQPPPGTQSIPTAKVSNVGAPVAGKTYIRNPDDPPPPTPKPAAQPYKAPKYEPPVLASAGAVDVAYRDPESDAARRSSLTVPIGPRLQGTGLDPSYSVAAQYTGSGTQGGANQANELQQIRNALIPPPSGPTKDANTSFYERQGNGVGIQQINDQTVAAGTIIPATLITQINSDLPGQILAYVNANVYDTLTGRNLLIPQGSRLIAQYNNIIGWGQNRVQIGWTRVLRPDGVVVNLGNMPGTDMAGASGVAADVDGHGWDYMLALGFMMSTQLALSELEYSTAQSRSQGAQRLGNIAQETLGPPVNQLGTQFLNNTMARPATLKVAQGKALAIFVISDLTMPTFVERRN